MPDGLILRIRAEALRASLKKMQKLLTPPRYSDLDPWEEHLAKIQATLKNAWVTSQSIEFMVSFPSDNNEALKTDVEKLRGLLRSMLDELDLSGKTINARRHKCFRIKPEFADSVEGSLKALTYAPLNAVEAMQTRLGHAEVDYGGEWKEFRGRTFCISQSIFTEYLDLLGGLALRDAGFDMSMSQLAEEVIRSYCVPSKTTAMQAIPARQQAMALTLSRIIRVTFPDWTIWSLPATAYEFWRVIAQKDLVRDMGIALRQLSTPNDQVEDRFSECIGDAFATYTVGPAYACYCICLQLDPANTYQSVRPVPAGETWDCGQEQPQKPSVPGENQANLNRYPGDGVRVRAILRMLKLMNSKGPANEPPYKDLSRTLWDAWAEAADHAGEPPTPEILAAYETDSRRAELLVDALWKTTANNPSAPFTVEVWNQVLADWLKPLLEGRPDSIPLPAGVELRHVLNAVWMARIDRGWNPDLASAAEALAQRVWKPGIS